MSAPKIYLRTGQEEVRGPWFINSAKKEKRKNYTMAVKELLMIIKARTVGRCGGKVLRGERTGQDGAGWRTTREKAAF